jgi:putative transposase
VSRPHRIQLVDRRDPELALATQAKLLHLARSSLYYQPVGPSDWEVELKHRIDRIYTDYPFYGSRRMAHQLGLDGFAVNRKTVQRAMREMGLEAIAPGPNLSRRNQQHKVYPYLLRNVAASYPNHVWGIDITYVALRKRWLYLVAILDWYSRYVVSWELSETLDLAFVLTAVKHAFEYAQPSILNSDQGSHFTSPHYIQLVQAAGSKVSMDGKGRAVDNIFTERLWRTVKWEHIYLADHATLAEAYQGLTAYFQYYDQQRPHQALGYATPAQVYFGLAAGAGP